MSRKKIWLAQQAVWDINTSGLESMPLACGYLKAMADGDERVRAEADVRIFNFGGADTTLRIIQRMLLADVPDVAAFSILGWNYNLFGRVTETYRQLRPDGWIIFGGTHVTNQAERVFRTYPVDVVVNGEGERTFLELLHAYLGGRSPRELHEVQGISFRDADGRVVTTPARPRIERLDDIPSPFITGAMSLTNDRGEFKYDVAIMETNRGCPYKCAFCFWGGAIGQKIRAFSLDRLREEIEIFARMGVASIVLCDANFGMTKADEQFLDVLIKARERWGFPRHVVTSWAKNKEKPFYSMVRRMMETGFHSSFTLALQTLSEAALKPMNRKNMRVNEWQDVAARLHREGFDLYAELMWGCPGETYDSFIAGYDDLAANVTRIAVYPHVVLPNTDFSERRGEFAFVTWRAGADDFEYVLSHCTMSVEDNRKMHRFLFWARVVGEYMLLRYIWAPLGKLAGITHSQVFLSLDQWFDRQEDAISAGMRACRAKVVDHFDAYAVRPGLHYFYSESGLDELMERWWREEIIPLVAEPLRPFFVDLFRYDWETRPVLDPTRVGYRSDADQDETVSFDAERYYVGQRLTFDFDVPRLVRNIIREVSCDFTPRQHEVVLFYRVGFGDYISNHEFFPRFVGKTEAELRAEGRRDIDGAVLRIAAHDERTADVPAS